MVKELAWRITIKSFRGRDDATGAGTCGPSPAHHRETLNNSIALLGTMKELRSLAISLDQVQAAPDELVPDDINVDFHLSSHSFLILPTPEQLHPISLPSLLRLIVDGNCEDPGVIHDVVPCLDWFRSFCTLKALSLWDFDVHRLVPAIPGWPGLRKLDIVWHPSVQRELSDIGTLIRSAQDLTELSITFHNDYCDCSNFLGQTFGIQKMASLTTLKLKFLHVQPGDIGSAPFALLFPFLRHLTLELMGFLAHGPHKITSLLFSLFPAISPCPMLETIDLKAADDYTVEQHNGRFLAHFQNQRIFPNLRACSFTCTDKTIYLLNTASFGSTGSTAYDRGLNTEEKVTDDFLKLVARSPNSLELSVCVVESFRRDLAYSKRMVAIGDRIIRWR